MPTAVVKALVVQCRYCEEKETIVITEEVAVKSTNSTAEQVSFQKCYYSKISNTGLLLLLFKSLKVS